MSLLPLKIESLAGGLNNRDSPSALAANEAQELVNYLTDEEDLFSKRGGQTLIQYAPIDPQPFVSDGDTLSLLHFDESASPYSDDTGFITLTGTSLGASPRGLFSNGLRPIPTTGFATGGFASSAASGKALDSTAPLTMEIWVILDPSISGRPQTFTYLGKNYTFSPNDGAVLYGRTVVPAGNAAGIVNGFTVHRDWDTTEAKDTSDPYVKFRLQTSGIPGEVTTLTSNALPTSRQLHIKVTYNNATGEFVMTINGTVHSRTIVNGAGNIDTTDENTWCVGGHLALLDSDDGTAQAAFAICVPGILDEARTSTVVRTGVPFKKPRGVPIIFELSTGEAYVVVAADAGLWYTTGNGEWANLASTDFATGNALDSSENWDGRNIGDKLYLSNGINTPIAWNGSKVVDWMSPSKPPTVTASAVSGAIVNGTYLYAFSYKYDLVETGLSPSVSHTVSGNLLPEISGMLTRHSNCTAVCVYRTKEGTTTPFYKIREVTHVATENSMSMLGAYAAGSPTASVTGDSGADGLADTSLGTNTFKLVTAKVLATQTRKAKYLLPIHGRMLVSGVNDQPYTIFPSDLNAPDVLFSAIQIRLKADRGRVIGMANDNGDVIVSKNARGTSAVSGSSPSNWQVAENIHPNIGAVSHWAFANRISETGGRPSILTFWGPDGEYRLRGHVVERISGKIEKTVKSLSSFQGTKEAFVQTTPSDFQSASANNGSASQNMEMPISDVDGLRQTPGAVEIVNQLDNIGLWGATSSTFPSGVTGKMIAICKGPAEGEFFFAVDDDRLLHHTLDNFETITTLVEDPSYADMNLDAVTGSPALVTDDHRIIEITYASIGGKDTYWVFTSDGDSKGSLCRWNQTDGSWDNGAASILDDLYWESDTYMRYNSVLGGARRTDELPNDGLVGASSGASSKDFYIVGRDPNLAGASSNVWLNHDQRIVLTPVLTAAMAVLSAPSLNANANVLISPAEVNTTTRFVSGFYAIRDSAQIEPSSYSGNIGTYAYASSGGFTTDFSHRETAMWNGGTFRPQSFYDDVNGQIIFSTNSADNSSGHKQGKIVAVSDNFVATTVHAPQLSSNMSIVKVGTDCYYTLQSFDAITKLGFYTFIYKFDLAGLTPSFVSSLQINGSPFTNFLPLRLSYNAESGKVLATGKDFSGSTWAYYGIIYSLDISNGNCTLIKRYERNNNAGAFPMEVVYQTDTPFAHHIVNDSLTTDDPEGLLSVDSDHTDAVTLDSTGYDLSTTGVLSNAVYVSQSGLAGDFLWSDRFYWAAKRDTNGDGTTDTAKPIQRGLPGTWTVKGNFVSSSKDLGDFDAFGSLVSDFSGDVSFFFRNAATVPGLLASELPQSPGVSIVGFDPAEAYVQWRSLLVWSYTVASPSLTPSVKAVEIEFFLGNPNIPLVTSLHYAGRTYFFVAVNGALENNLSIINMKNDNFTTYDGWNIKGAAVFRGMFIAIQGYELVRLEHGKTDQGKLISGKAKVSAVIGNIDKAIDDVEANVLTITESKFPTTSGYIQIRAFRGADALPTVWMIPLAKTATPEVRREHASVASTFTWDWANVFSVEIKTSEDATLKPSVDQDEVVQQVELTLVTAQAGRESNIK